MRSRRKWKWARAMIPLLAVITLGCAAEVRERDTTGGASSWSSSSKLLEEGYIYDLFASGEDIVWAAGAYGKLFQYDGKDWQPVSLPEVEDPKGERPPRRDYHIFDLFFLSPDNGWAVGEDRINPKQGVMFHYDGKAWSFVENPSGDSLLSIHFTSPGNGWAVGASSNILHYDGTQWEKVKPPRFCYLSGMTFNSPEDGWAVGNEGVILHYDGTAWKEVESPTRDPLYSLYFSSPQEGWAVGDTGTIIHYQGGEWKSSESPTDLSLFSVYFKGPQEGYAVGAAGTILRYRGVKWEAMESPTSKFLYTVSYEDPLGLLVGGREKVVFNNPKLVEEVR